ncbi:hypothetical protein QUF50_08495 [Thiotrichales bacterium HSG1]|nr:hypothetical protein [Thiotrichales bacterium HSG1]
MLKESLDEPISDNTGSETRSLQLKSDSSVWKFVPTIKHLLTSLFLLIFFGLFLFMIPIFTIFNTNGISGLTGLLGSLFYLAVVAVYIVMLLEFWDEITKPPTFDTDLGLFYFGNKPNNKALKLDDIACLQIFRKYIHIPPLTYEGQYDDISYYCYEFNVVFKSGTRFNLIEHDQEEIIKQEAEQLANLLKVECRYTDC